MIRTYLILILLITNSITLYTIYTYRVLGTNTTYAELHDKDALVIEQELIDTRYALNLLKEGIRIGEKNKGCK